jgi:hypothetical protein
MSVRRFVLWVGLVLCVVVSFRRFPEGVVFWPWLVWRFGAARRRENKMMEDWLTAGSRVPPARPIKVRI